MLFSILCSKRRANLQGRLTPLWLRYCIAIGAGAEGNDVNAIPGLSEPYGPDAAVAHGGGVRPQISGPGSAGRRRQGVWTAWGRAPVDLAILPDLYPPRLRDRPGQGRES